MPDAERDKSARGISSIERRALALADNKIAANAGWNEKLLVEELTILDSVGDEFSIHGITGFETVEIDNRLIAVESADASTEDKVPSRSAEPAISRLGDLWLAGAHRIYCGNALDEAAYINVMDGEKARMVFTDPPYNVRIAGTSADSAGRSIASSLWRPARCRPSASRSS